MASIGSFRSRNAAKAARAAWSERGGRPSLASVPEPIAEEAYQRMLGSAIVELRVLRGVSQAELAEALDRSEAAVSRWETGKVTPTAYDLRRLSEVLEVPAEWLAFPPDWSPPVSPLAERFQALLIEAQAKQGAAGAVDRARGAIPPLPPDAASAPGRPDGAGDAGAEEPDPPRRRRG